MLDKRRRNSWWPVTMIAVAAITLVPAALIAQVTVTIDVTGDAVPGGTITATATVDGGTATSYAWEQVSGPAVTIDDATTASATVTLPDKAAFKAHLIEVLHEPPITEEQLPPNVPVPGEGVGVLQDRFQVVGINPFNLEEGGLVVLEVTVGTASGNVTAEEHVVVDIGYQWTTGLLNVPMGVPVLLHGKDQDSYDWSMSTPGGSGAALMEASSQNPEFVPDVPGLYEVQVTDQAAGEGVTLAIYAGTWRGVIVGQDADGRPVADGSCTGCHSGFAPDKFTPWKDSGHAEIFTNNLNTSDHYSTNCFSCHTVGYMPGVDNGGIDEASDFEDFLASDLLPTISDDNWTTMLADFPDSAQQANIQCENCHGPQESSNAHGPNNPMGEPRVSLSADVCAFCHGEPLRHGRYQQWQLSGHANYELAIDEGESGSCSRCHTANGFLTWLPVLLDDDPETDPTANIEVTWTADEVHPQTCATCHDPHAEGTTTGVDTDATVRISGDTPPLIAGFTANNVGRGAICMTCHNTRRGLRNDSTWAQVVADGDQGRAPHPGAQTDVIMGQNLYFVPVGNQSRSPHSRTANVEDVCVTCHMEATPPPADLSYNQGGTNHTFFASPTICGKCHGFEDGSIVQDGVEAKLEELDGLIVQSYFDLLQDKLAAGYSIDFGGDFTATAPSDVQAVTEFGDSHGRQAISVRLAGNLELGPYSLNSIALTPPGGEAMALDQVANSNLLKAGWNYTVLESDESDGVHNPSFVNAALDASIANVEAPPPLCDPSANTLCLNANNRFKVEIMYDDGSGPKPGNAVSTGQRDSGLFWFFDENNIEMLVKVLDACNLEGFNSFWVFYSAGTNVGFDLTVTDTETDTVKVYSNPQGTLAPPLADTAAFACP